jgi:hypothetical protein
MANVIILKNYDESVLVDDEDFEWASTMDWYAVRKSAKGYRGVVTPILTQDNAKVWLFLHDLAAIREGMIGMAPCYSFGREDIPNCSYEVIEFRPMPEEWEPMADLCLN